MDNKIIDFNHNSDYKKRLEKTSEFLENVNQGLLNEIVDLAMVGKWKEWSDEQPEGTRFSFSDEMLKDTGDDNINMLCDLREELYEILEKLK